ncbi:MAG: DUF4954 family protein, partial [Paludibacteraceae bacterium]|nr:DUF4954 family protein [Paludibacteraceae bacterium]
MSKTTDYRALTPAEIQELENRSCTCDRWSEVMVGEGFSPIHFKHVHFSGKIRLGRFDTEYELEGGVKRHAGIYHACLHNCTVHDNVFICKVLRYIANYEIGADSYIENVELLATTEASCFGNGTEVAVLNETGGREIRIYDHLSSHVAYILAMYRHRTATIDRINRFITDYCESIRSAVGKIGQHVTIVNCGTIKNLKVGDHTRIEGANLLVNGSINSNASDPIYIGEGVIAKNFIFSSGAQITDASLVENCFIGQGTQIGKHFSIYDSLYFCNCQGFHGEACAIFGGPYTVTHHKSSLLIAGMFSFLNAGSGSNQSNHMYKLGPIHQGVVERGSKTTSDSYILWPAKVGPFSLVMGR